MKLQQLIYFALDKKRKYKLVVCLGKSMKNFCGISIMVFTQYQSYNIGDVISFIGKNNNYYCHRIIGIDNQSFTAKGDNLKSNNEYETQVSIKNIQGKVCWSFP